MRTRKRFACGLDISFIAFNPYFFHFHSVLFPLNLYFAIMVACSLDNNFGL